MNILIVKLSAIGDVIHTLPALNAIRAAYPSACISWLVEESAAPLIAGHPALNRIIISKRKSWIKAFRAGQVKSTLQEAAGWIHEFRKTSYDLVLDFQAHLKSGILIALAKGKRKIGFDRGMEHQEHSYFFLNERIPPIAMDRHAILRNLEMLAAIGIHSGNIDYHLPLQPEDCRNIDIMLHQNGFTNHLQPLICINPMAKWDTKLWPTERFAVLADRLAEHFQTLPVFTGSLDDRAAVRNILSGMKFPAVDLSGQTSLKTLAALYEKADIVISTDTGPMHLAAAVETPVVALFGPTAPWRTGPLGHIHQVIRSGIPCSPCFKRQCPTTACMRQIDVDRVVESVSAILKSAKQEGEMVMRVAISSE